MSARPLPEGAGRYDSCHGDEDQPCIFGPAEQVRVETRSAELLAERMDDPDQFADLMSGLDSSAIDPHLQRALLNLDRACKGDQVSVDAVLSALHLIQQSVNAEAAIIWKDECEALAEIEVVS